MEGTKGGWQNGRDQERVQGNMLRRGESFLKSLSLGRRLRAQPGKGKIIRGKPDL